MDEKKKELSEKEISKVSGGWGPGENMYTYCPFCYDRPNHLIHVVWSDLECLVCHNHHRRITSDQGGNPDPTDLQNFYKEIGYVPTNPNQKQKKHTTLSSVFYQKIPCLYIASATFLNPAMFAPATKS